VVESKPHETEFKEGKVLRGVAWLPWGEKENPVKKKEKNLGEKKRMKKKEKEELGGRGGVFWGKVPLGTEGTS